MKELLIVLLGTAGLSWIVVRSELFRSTRETISSYYIVNKKGNELGGFAKLKYRLFWSLNELMNCHGCFGFWGGVLNSILVYKSINMLTIVYGFSGSIISLLVIGTLKFLNKG